MRVYVGSYRKEGIKRDWEKDCKFFVELISPLLDENYKLKDTILEMTNCI